MQNVARFRLSLLAGATLFALSAVPALAQDQTAATTAAQADTNDQSGLGEIIVTAQRRETNLQQTPISISVLNSEALQDRHVQSLFNLA
ncbi:TonB-dependent receptor, partial [Escherichia coli]|nr:TonB-dependent receptor [Escherichia coli]